MPKDSQLDPKEVRKKKSNGGPTFAESALDGEGRNNKKQSGNRHKPGDDKKQLALTGKLFYLSGKLGQGKSFT